MSIVGAYIELKPGEEPPLESYDNWEEGFFQSKTAGGLNVKWMEYGEPPETGAQFYLAWEPKVYVVWNNEEGEDHGEVGEDDSEPGFGDEEGVEQPDEGIEESSNDPEIGTPDEGGATGAGSPEERGSDSFEAE